MRYGLSETVIERLTSVFASNPKIEVAILFGSRAKGTYKEGSDIDIALKGDLLDLPALRKIELEIDVLFLPYAVDMILFHKINEPLLTEHIKRFGICIYKKQTKSA